MIAYDEFFLNHQDKKATKTAEAINDTYLTTSGETAGTRSYDQVSDLLIDWYIQEIVMPSQKEEEIDRFDPTKVDLSVTLPTEASEEETESTESSEGQ